MTYHIGIDFGGMSAKAGLFADGALLAKKTAATSPLDGAERTAEIISRLAKDICIENGTRIDDVQAIGIGSPGIIDSETGTVLVWGNYHWNNIPLGEMVSRHTGKPVFITNDANAAALGEAKHGSGKAYSDSILVTLGTGVGGGIVIQGKLFEGFHGAGAEIGHMVMVKDGMPCGCGRKGCFETYASATALKRITREAMLAHPESSMHEMCSVDNVSGKTAFEASRKGDVVAQEVVDTYIDYLSEGLADLVNVFRPAAILLGGGVSNEGENLLGPLREAVEKKIYLSSAVVPLAIVKASLGNDAGIYGAFEYALSRV
ncbi:MAG: ROK family protein [Christensenellaceae bacterium]